MPLLERLVEFTALLRRHGLDAGPREAADAARALAVVDPGVRWQVFLALQAVFCHRPEDFDPFSRAFGAFWERQAGPGHPRDPGGDGEGEGKGEQQRTAELDGAGVDVAPDRESAAPSYSPAALLRRDVGEVTAEELPALQRLAEELARRLAQRLSRRLRRRRRGHVDPARTLRRALRQGGEVLQLHRRRPPRQKAHLVSLLDVSGSMQPYGRFLLLFLIALAERLPRTETFIFSTELTQVTQAVLDGNLEKIAGSAPDWAGGTRIGLSLDRFLRQFAPTRVGRRTAVLVMSDGLDTGETRLLVRAMGRLRRRAGRIVWLNPLAGDPAYAPLARGMSAALPYVDVLAPAHNLESLLQLGRYLTGGSA